MSSQPDPIRVSVVHPWDPWRQGIGGFDTFLDGFLRYAPPEWEIELVGTTAAPRDRAVGRWQVLNFAGRSVRFFPVLADPMPNLVHKIPLSLQFALAARIRRPRLSGQLVVYHRFESAYAVPPRSADQSSVFYLHNHPAEIDSPSSDVRWARMGQVFRWLLLRKLAAASLVVCVDPRTPTWIANAVPGLDGKVIRQRQWADPAVFNLNGAGATSEGRSELRRRLGLDADLKLLVFAGRFEKQKAPLKLLRIFEEARRQIGRLGLVLVGEGRLRHEMERVVADQELGEVVRFVRPVPRSELATIYRVCDVAVCTSSFEAGPRHVFEALACGLPVVSFDVGQVADVIGRDCHVGYLAADRSDF